MRRLPLGAGILLLCLFVAAPSAEAQVLDEGLWSGSVTPPGAPAAIDVMFMVRDVDGALTITMSNPDLGPMELNDEAFHGDALTFWWNAGVRVDCALHVQENGNLEGICADPRGTAGGEGAMTMVPPEAPPAG